MLTSMHLRSGRLDGCDQGQQFPGDSGDAVGVEAVVGVPRRWGADRDGRAGDAVAAEPGGTRDHGGMTEHDSWHRGLHHISRDALSADTTQTPGMRRLEAISGKTVGSEKLWMGETHVAPSTASGDHHHGEAETAIYVVSGHPVFVFADGEREVRLETQPGDYI